MAALKEGERLMADEPKNIIPAGEIQGKIQRGDPVEYNDGMGRPVLDPLLITCGTTQVRHKNDNL
jgi:hypothetical protein